MSIGEARGGAAAEALADAQPRSFAARLTLMVCAAFFFAGFVALGTWQVYRLQWKLALIARVEDRVHAQPAAPPPPARWAEVSAERDEYRHVRIEGRYLAGRDTLVNASTELGPGYWLMTPLRGNDGALVMINRGYVSAEEGARLRRAGSAAAAENADAPVVITGLLRIGESAGFYPRSNNPSADRWFSRELQAIAAARGLEPVAPYFIDADAASAQAASGPDAHPVGGMTVLAFHNNHLVYALTWYALALMTAGALWWLLRDEIRLRRR